MTQRQVPNPSLILPVGTRVVTKVDTQPVGGGQLCPAGMVGVVVASPTDHSHAYRVRCANGSEIAVRRAEIELLREHQTAGLTQQDPVAEYDLRDHIMYRCVIGSRAYGLEHEASDTDYRGFYLAPAELHWSLFGAPEQLENEEAQECFWELQKFILLALKANPNVLECLYTPLVEYVSPLGAELVGTRDIFLSKLVYQTYNGYVLSQFKRMNQHRRNHGNIKPKHAMHLIRLLISGIQVLKEGFVPVRVDTHRDDLLAIRDGLMPWDDVEAWRLKLHEEFDKAFQNTRLPDRPDYEKANAFLLRARHRAATATATTP
jgi:predicted nucleotidyltransferase